MIRKMILIFVFSLIFFLLISPLSCENNHQILGKYFDRWRTIEFLENELVYTVLNPDTGISKDEVYKYKIQDQLGMTFIVLNGGEKKWLALYNEEILFLYNSEEESKSPFFVGTKPNSRRLESLLFNFNEITTSSSLNEHGIDYSSSNLCNINLWSPWVEGVTGDGIGESIDLKEYGANHLNISIGFVSFDKPYLYKYNSRPKRIKITNVENGHEFFFNLKDSPNPQPLYFSEDAYHIQIVIEEVYKGEKWEDTCVNSLFFF